MRRARGSAFSQTGPDSRAAYQTMIVSLVVSSVVLVGVMSAVVVVVIGAVPDDASLARRAWAEALLGVLLLAVAGLVSAGARWALRRRLP